MISPVEGAVARRWRRDLTLRPIIDCAALSFTIPDKRRVGASINLVIAGPGGAKARLT
jgi:hypothetical protein